MTRYRDNTRLLSDNLLGLVVRLAAPMIIAFVFITSYHFVDRFFVSRLGDTAIAAIGMAFTVQMIIISVGSGLGQGINSYIARNLGAERDEVARQVVLHTFLLAVGIGGVIGILGLLGQRFLFTLLGAEGELLDMIVAYLTVLFIFTPVNLFNMFFSSVFQGYGDTMTPMKFTLMGTGINLLLDPLLMFGFGGIPGLGWFGALLNTIPDPFALMGLGAIPAMGIRGAALATVISQVISAMYILARMFGRGHPTRISFRAFRYQPDIIRGVSQVGLPSSVSQVLGSVSRGVVFWILIPFGDVGRAAYTIVFTYEMVVFLPSIGVSQAVSILTGHNYGAGNYERVRKVHRLGIAVGLGMMALLAAVVLIDPMASAGIFARSDAVREVTAVALQYVLVGSVFLSIYLASVASFQGLGLGRQYLLATILRMFVLLIPLSYAGSRLLGIEGVWMGMLAVNVMSSIILFSWHQFVFRTRIATGSLKTF